MTTLDDETTREPTRDRLARVLVTFGSKRGGTAGIAAAVARTLRERGLAVDCMPTDAVRDLAAYDAVIIGGALYANRWISAARRFVTRHDRELRRRAVWMFSSGPLDDTATRAAIPPVPRVAALMTRVGARGHATFGGRLAADAQGFPASAMARTRAGDWRDWERIAAWASEVAHALIALPHVAPVPVPAPAVPAPRWLLATLCLFVAVTAIAGGLALVIRPDGSLLHMPLSALDHTPFSSFLIPGLLLSVVIGLGNLLAAALVLIDAPGATVVAFAAGAALATWIVAQMIMLRSAHWLQLTYLGIGVVITLEAARRRAMTSLAEVQAAATYSGRISTTTERPSTR